MAAYEQLSAPTFNEKLEQQWQQSKFACVGLDPNLDEIHKYYPEFQVHNNDAYSAITNFNRVIIDETIDITAAYKLDPGFYYQYLGGETAMIQTVREIQMRDSKIVIIIDGKYGGTQFANSGYAEYVFGRMGVDAVTVRPVGEEALEPFIEYPGKGVFVVVRTSDPGSEKSELQKSHELCETAWFQPIFIANAYKVAKEWHNNSNCGLVVAGTHKDDLAAVRSAVGDLPILVPAIGVQGGSSEEAMLCGQDSIGTGILGSSSRAITYPNITDSFTHRECVRASALELHNSLKHNSNKSGLH